MMAVVGSLFLAAGVVLYQWAFIQHRRPKLPGWLRREFVSQMLCFAILLIMALGASLGIQYFVAHGWAGLDGAEIGMLSATAVVSVAAIVAMQRYWRRRKGEWAAVAVANAGTPSDHDPRPAGNGRRKAA